MQDWTSSFSSNFFAGAFQLFALNVTQNRTEPVVVVLLFVWVRHGCCNGKGRFSEPGYWLPGRLLVLPGQRRHALASSSASACSRLC